MKAAYFYGVEDVRVEDVPIPEIKSDEILIQVKASAICGTDLRIYKGGHFKIPAGSKRVLGHEVAGIIAKCGKNVTDYTIGMRISLPPNVGCGTCPMCLKGLNNMCSNYEAFGISYDGGFQEYMRVPAEAIRQGNVIPIPDSMSFEEAAVAEPLSCTYHSYRALKTKPGDTVLIIGAGPIGACHVMINKLAGATKIIVADISDARLSEIKRYGADYTINSDKKDLKDFIFEQTAGVGADIVITACSVPSIQTLALEVAAPLGRVNFFGGMPSGKEMVTLNTNLIHYKELTVLGTTGSSLDDFNESLSIAASGKIHIGDLVTARFSIESANEAFAHAVSGKGMKTVFAF
ncbi:zinc-dependent dehydrogenase [Eubacterium barkeri]|uniref:Threonine dehydrogenase n=1 Tax=Eubacterium barkeri TaxID=1528 RepID=A0A1H3JK27_EUBBA|nr:zinc-dependent dehydrogenase [Eubacterium barkeri]SDY40276.1 Threonine dehydrogenase [Eubacterium barkeri]